MQGGDPTDAEHRCGGVLIVDGQYFDHYDIEALEGALLHCYQAAANTAAEVNEPETDLILAATALARLALKSAFVSNDNEDYVALAIEWMDTASTGFGAYAESCIQALAETEQQLGLSRVDALPQELPNILARFRVVTP
jgi:regulator of RNase E activity RraB